jgi:hypothetical protein
MRRGGAPSDGVVLNVGRGQQTTPLIPSRKRAALWSAVAAATAFWPSYPAAGAAYVPALFAGM